MPKKIEFTRCEIVKGEIVETQYTETYPDEKVRHCDACTVCGWSEYPECLKECHMPSEEDRKKGLELV